MIKRVLARLLVPVLALGALAVVVAQPAQAASCATSAHVYETSRSPWLIKYGSDATNGPFGQREVNVPNTGNWTYEVTLGGNGLAPGSRPSWDVYSDNGGYVGVLNGNTTGGNCVSNEISYPIIGSAGHYYEIKANYDFGSGGNQRSQNHFIVYFY